MDNWGMSASSILAILLVLVSLAVVDARMLPAAPWARSVLLSLSCAATGMVSWLLLAPVVLPDVVTPLFLPIAALGGVASYLATIAVRANGYGIVITLLFGASWSLLVYVPTAIRTFVPFEPSWSLGINPIDHGGSLPVNVAAGAAVLGVLLCGGPRLRTASVSRITGMVGMIGLSVGWLVWLAGAEFAVDDTIGAIVANGVIGAGGGVVGWLCVQRIRHRSVTLNSVAAGLISGLVAMTAGAPLFTPVSAAAAGIMAGGAACIFTIQRVSSSRRQQWFVVGTHLIAGGAGAVLLGLLASNIGFIFTGSVTLIGNQVAGTVVVAGYSLAVSVLLMMILRLASRAVTALRVPSKHDRTDSPARA
ncbi:ammonium transporter [Salinibacterium sp. G-O1]|uniref:ammonium transporter n=1 Tax=Salinibacterium sp. G-O1 TaxID=3046208 RepID=UPI0024BACAD3|nr:ammonium transporter [Salinibacterium sp. G-O1]MDJ0335229.1 ammonium transporter [Salinibacterium sp. G-O1]